MLPIRCRIYEDRELQAAEKRSQERLDFENQIIKIQTMLEFERSRDTAGHVQQVKKEVATLEDALQKCQKNEKKYRKVTTECYSSRSSIDVPFAGHRRSPRGNRRDQRSLVRSEEENRISRTRNLRMHQTRCSTEQGLQ